MSTVQTTLANEDGVEYDTSLPLKTKWYELIRSGDKTVEIREQGRGLEPGDRIRFMKGYDPATNFKPL